MVSFGAPMWLAIRLPQRGHSWYLHRPGVEKNPSVAANDDVFATTSHTGHRGAASKRAFMPSASVAGRADADSVHRALRRR